MLLLLRADSAYVGGATDEDGAEDRLVGAEAAWGRSTFTSGMIFRIVAGGTPARVRSLTELYGRPATIFFAVAGPTPGSLSSSSSLAVFKSTGRVGASVFDAGGADCDLDCFSFAYAGAFHSAQVIKDAITHNVEHLGKFFTMERFSRMALYRQQLAVQS